MAKQVTMSAAEFLSLGEQERRAKYGNKKVRCEDGVFDSQHEYRCWLGLRDREKKGEITGLRRQVAYLLEAQNIDTLELEAVGKYIADFVYDEPRQMDETEKTSRKRLGLDAPFRSVVADAKGVRTSLFKWKARHMKAQFGIEVKEL